MFRSRLMGLLGLALLVAALLPGARACAARWLGPPSDNSWHKWEAEDAQAEGAWRAVADPSASGGKYEELSPGAGSLRFSFSVDRPTTLRFKPLWWRDSERKPARRFPYPFERLAGPDAVDYCGEIVAFTAPTAGRVGLLDARTERLLPPVELGGYLTDLVADRDAGVVYVADALGRRLVALNPATGEMKLAVALPARPWSLALFGGKLWAACREPNCLCRLDPAAGPGMNQQQIPLDAPPISVDASGGRLTVRFQTETFHVMDLAPTPGSQPQFVLSGARLTARYGDKSYDSPGPHALRVTVKGKPKQVDVTAVTAGPSNPPLPWLPDVQGPACMVVCGSRLFFTAPRTGRLGVLDTKTDTLVGSVTVGGRPVDLAPAPDGRKLYVADAWGGRVVVVDARTLGVVKELKTPAEPCSLEVVASYAVQRDYLLPATPVNRLFVACRASRALAVVDTVKDTVVKELPLGAMPRRVRMLPMPSPDWWPLLADDRISFALTPRVGVEPLPVTLDPAGLAVSPAPDAPEPAPARNVAKLKLDGAEKTFQAGNDLLLRVNNARDVDVSAVADPQFLPDRGLAGGDEPGSITLRLDDGPEYDCTHGVWMRPDNNEILVADSEEFWHWNAPGFDCSPGAHTLTVRARGAAVALDALGVQRTAEGTCSLDLRPEPWALHSQVPTGAYQGVFYDAEPIRFTVTVTNRTGAPQQATLSSRLQNYMGEPAGEAKPVEMDLEPGAAVQVPLEFSPAETGRFRLLLSLEGAGGEVTRDALFVRLPKLTHPRLMFRPSDLPQISARIAQHPRLFQRYADWLKRQSARSGMLPERFLPNGLTAEALNKVTPRGQRYNWRMYELGWRMLGMEFAARYIPGADRATLDARMGPLLNCPTTDYWCQFHHHGPFFPGAVESLVDMAPREVAKDLPLTKYLASQMGDVNILPFTLVSFEEPLSPRDRALIYRLVMLYENFDRYFTTHTGTRGGTWWQNPWSWCYCPTQGIFLEFLFTGNLLGESRIFEKPFFRGYLTFMEYADPISDQQHILPELHRPSGEPWRWILTAITRHPLEKSQYPWDAWVKKLDGDLPQPETQAVDDLFALKGMPMSGPLVGAPHHFNTAVAIPVALALGWYDPAAPTVTFPQLPPTALFDVDGWAQMRSGRDGSATEVAFMCGARDHTNLTQPGNFTLVKSGNFLLGTPSVWGDDGNCNPAWGNTVVAGDKWLGRWQVNLEQPRNDENMLINRFSPAAFTYILRDRRRAGYNPAESGWGGGIDMHGHTETPLTSQGRILAYETWPEFDYVAGDAGNAWPPEEMRRHYRQVVFVKPDTVVIYDRVQLGPEGHTSAWLAAVAPGLSLAGDRFRTWVGGVGLTGQVLLPRDARLGTLPPAVGFLWGGQQALQITPARQADDMEYLVVLTTGAAGRPEAKADLIETTTMATARLALSGRTVTVSFHRRGPVGGTIGFLRPGSVSTHRLAPGIEDTYVHWQSDPRYRSWVKDRRFDFVVPKRDRQY